LKTSFTLTRQQLILLIAGVFLLTILISQFWHYLHTPMHPIYVDIYNETEEVIPSVVIEHGNVNTQEKIQSIQIQPQEHRIIALNHQPKLGFSITANYANGKESEICAGKWSEKYYLRAHVSRFGIYMTDVR
jgi:hypothetical protein